ncbi:rCG60532 [Rattus norvegicus]|uniref:RCG60532 n=1 Tax=Rattus norvegicus TaxID=10116 RepID=A6JKU0_RAT|nr:rCG60532 [Rattus norvegicus]
MKPGPCVSELWDARWRRCRGCTHTGGAWAPGRLVGTSVCPASWGSGLGPSGEQSRAGCVRAVPRPLPAASHPLPNIRWPSILGSGKVGRKSWKGKPTSSSRGHCGLSRPLSVLGAESWLLFTDLHKNCLGA